MSAQLERPIRFPDTTSGPLMTKRARWLVVLGFFVPGLSQVLAGNRKLGRIGLFATGLLLLSLLAAAVGVALAQEATLSFFTQPLVLLSVQWGLFVYAVLWLVLGVDTLRLVKLVSVAPRWRLPIAMFAVVLTVLPVGAAAWAGLTVGAARGAIGDIFGGGAPSVEPIDGRYNIAMLGVDAGDDREGLRPDSISVISIDAKTGQSAIIGMYRYLENMPFPAGSPMNELHPNGFGLDWGCNVGNCYLNAVYAEVEYFMPELYPTAVANGSSPGIQATLDAASGATGLDIQFYVMVDMAGFASIIDALGGVEINVTERLPIGGQINEATGQLEGVVGWIEPGLQRMDGFTAEWYARSRFGSGTGDYDRMERQRELQAAILAQMNPANVLTRFQAVAATGANVVQTDIPQSMLGRFVDLATRAKNHTPVSLELVPPTIDPQYPDYTQIHGLVDELIAQASPVPEE